MTGLVPVSLILVFVCINVVIFLLIDEIPYFICLKNNGLMETYNLCKKNQEIQNERETDICNDLCSIFSY